jgi:hypothetical protein
LHAILQPVTFGEETSPSLRSAHVRPWADPWADRGVICLFQHEKQGALFGNNLGMVPGMRPSGYLLIPVLSLCIVGGCKKAVPPESYLYYGSLAGVRVPDGVQLYLDDKVVGTVKGSLSFRLPHGTLLSTSFHRLTLRLATPCGLTQPVRLKVRALTEQAERKKQEDEPNSGHYVTLEVEGNPTWPKSAMVCSFTQTWTFESS